MKYQTGLAGQSCALGVQYLVLGHAKHHQRHLNCNQFVLDKDSGFAFRVALLTFSRGSTIGCLVAWLVLLVCFARARPRAYLPPQPSRLFLSACTC